MIIENRSNRYYVYQVLADLKYVEDILVFTDVCGKACLIINNNRDEELIISIEMMLNLINEYLPSEESSDSVLLIKMKMNLIKYGDSFRLLIKTLNEKDYKLELDEVLGLLIKIKKLKTKLKKNEIMKFNLDYIKVDKSYISKVKLGVDFAIQCFNENAIEFRIAKNNSIFYDLILEFGGNIDYKLLEGESLAVSYFDYLYLLNLIVMKDLVLEIDINILNGLIEFHKENSLDLNLNDFFELHPKEVRYLFETILNQMKNFSIINEFRNELDHLVNLIIYRKFLEIK